MERSISGIQPASEKSSVRSLCSLLQKRKWARLALLKLFFFNIPGQHTAAWRNPSFSWNRRRKSNMTHIIIGAKNVHSLVEHGATDRPERRTVLVCRGLVWYNIQIAEISDNCPPGEDQLMDLGQDMHTLEWPWKETPTRSLCSLCYYQQPCEYIIVLPTAQVIIRWRLNSVWLKIK